LKHTPEARTVVSKKGNFLINIRRNINMSQHNLHLLDLLKICLPAMLALSKKVPYDLLCRDTLAL